MSKSGVVMSIPIAVLGIAVTVLIWLSTRALGGEHRITACEEGLKHQENVLREIKADLKELKAGQIELLRRVK
uniref:Uncharacterized protein n=1 Tax=viral metagenome TaxID=1070528 RepID=A0A6M3IU18_9ZZZZ